MYTSFDFVYLLKDKQIFKAAFTDREWAMEAVQNGSGINKLHQQKGELYTLKSKSFHKLQNGTISDNLLDSSSFEPQKMDFVDLDFDYEKEYLYILCKFEGVLVVNMAKGFKLQSKHVFDFPGLAYRMTVKNNTILINFKFQRNKYIAEFFLVASDAKSPVLTLNKFYHRFDDMDKVLLFNDFGLVYSLSQIRIFQHSINRKMPFGQLQTDSIYSASFSKIVDVIQLDQKTIHYMIVSKKGVFIELYQNQQSNSLLQSQIQCLFKKQGFYEIQVEYIGFCKDRFNPTEEYCAKKETYFFEVQDEKAKRQLKVFNAHLFTGLISILVFVLIAGIILNYRRRVINKREKIDALRALKQQSLEMNKKQKSIISS